MYEVISGGVVDAFCCINFESLETFNVTQYVASATEVPGEIFAPAFAVFLQSEIWDTLSAEDQAAIRSVSGEVLARRGSFGDPLEAEARQRVIDRGVPVVAASEAFVAELEAALAPVYDAWIAAVAGLGIDGRAALDFYLAEQASIRAGN
jgi:TRAP-type C4-dicarboxylate transport system substrate-binding protein